MCEWAYKTSGLGISKAAFPQPLSSPLCRDAELPLGVMIQIILELDGNDLFNALRINKRIYELYSDQDFWKKKLNISRTDKLSVQSLRYRYTRIFRAMNSIEGTCTHLWSEDWINGLGTMKLCTSELEASPVLFFRQNDKTGTTDIEDLQSDLFFQDQPFFQPDELFDNGRLCLGYDESGMAIYSVKDWSLVAQLKTDPNDTWLSCDRARTFWTTSGPESSTLLCIHRNGDSTGKIEIWDSTAKICKGILCHPEISCWVNLPGAEQFLTADKHGSIRIWDMLNFTYRNLVFDLGGTGPLVTVQRHGNILGFVNSTYKISYYHLHNQRLPIKLEGTSTRHEFWVTFSDGTHVFSEEVEDDQYHFLIFTSSGIQQGSFQQPATEKVITFMDRYIVTVAFAGDLNIWSKLGVLLFTSPLGYRKPALVEGKVGSLCALDFCEGSASRYQIWDFTRLEIEE